MNTFTYLSLTRRNAIAAVLFASLLPDTQAQEPTKRTPSPAAGFESITKEGYEAFVRLMVDFAKDQVSKLPSGDKSARENAYGKLAALQLAGAAGTLVLPAAGLTLGGGIGLCVDACTAGTDVGTGTAIGGAIGLGSGMVVGLGGFVGSLIATLPLVDEIEAKYPPEPAGAPGGGGMFFLPAMKRAGAAESFYVNMVASLPDVFVTVVEHWDKTPGLHATEKRWLNSIAFVRPSLQRLATIKKTLRATPAAAQAQDLFLDVGRILSGDEAAQERAWLNALGLTTSGLALKNDKLTLDVPPALVALGVPKTLSAKVPDLKFKVGGDGGVLSPYLRVAMDAGPFDLDLGKVTVVDSGDDKNLIRVDWTLAKGSRLGSLKLYGKAGGDESEVAKLAPKLDKAISVSMFFTLDGLALEFKKVRIQHVDIALGLPKELRDLPIVKDLAKALEDAFDQHVKGFLREHVPFAGLFAGMQNGAVKSLEKQLRAQPAPAGTRAVTKLEKVEIHGGKLRAHVKVEELQHPKLTTTPAQAAADWKRFAAR